MFPSKTPTQGELCRTVLPDSDVRTLRARNLQTKTPQGELFEQFCPKSLPSNSSLLLPSRRPPPPSSKTPAKLSKNTPPPPPSRRVPARISAMSKSSVSQPQRRSPPPSSKIPAKLSKNRPPPPSSRRPARLSENMKSTTSKSEKTTTATKRRLQRLRRLSQKRVKLRSPPIVPARTAKSDSAGARTMSEAMAEIRESRLENKRLHAQVRSLECQLTAMALIKNINRSEASSTFAAVARAFPGSVDVDELRARAEPAEEMLKHHTSFISVPDHDVKVVSSSSRLSQPLDSALDSGLINDDHEAQNMFCTDSYAASTNKEEAYLATIARLETELGVAKRHIQEQKDELIAWQVAAIHDDDTLPEHEEHLQGIPSSAAMVSAQRPPSPPINVHRANMRRLEADARLASQLQDQVYLSWSEGSVLQSFQSAQSSYAHGAAPPVLSSGDATMHSGYLLKCSRLMKNWQRRFFVFYKQERVLNYFGNDRSAKKGAVSLRHSGVQVERAEEILQIASGAVRALPRNVQKMPALHLRVLSPAMDGARARVMWLAATCEEDRERWIRVLLANES